jgi:hypothetical protein
MASETMQSVRLRQCGRECAAARKRRYRYLALSPDAPDARAAQDRIYEWEVKVR